MSTPWDRVSSLLVPCPAALATVLPRALAVLPEDTNGRFVDAAFDGGEAAVAAAASGRFEACLRWSDVSAWPTVLLGLDEAEPGVACALVSDGLALAASPAVALDALRSGMQRGGYVGCLLSFYRERGDAHAPSQRTWRCAFREAGYEVVRQERLHPLDSELAPDWLRAHGALYIVAVA